MTWDEQDEQIWQMYGEAEAEKDLRAPIGADRDDEPEPDFEHMMELRHARREPTGDTW